MPQDRIEEQLDSLIRAVRGDTVNGVPGLVQRLGEMQVTLLTMQTEQRQWRESVDARLRALEQGRPAVNMSARTAAFVTLVTAIIMALVLVAIMALNRAGA